MCRFYADNYSCYELIYAPARHVQKIAFHRSPQLSVLSANLLGGYQVFFFFKEVILEERERKKKQVQMSFYFIFRKIKVKKNPKSSVSKKNLTLARLSFLYHEACGARGSHNQNNLAQRLGSKHLYNWCLNYEIVHEFKTIPYLFWA